MNRKFIILTHRYLGIVLSPFFLMWFVSGIAMIFARGMPELSSEKRLELLSELNLGVVKISPAEAGAKAELDRPPARAVLLMIMGRPAYRFEGRGTVTIFADTGEPLPDIGQKEAMTITGSYVATHMDLPPSRLHYAGELDQADQWTLENRRSLPMHKLRLDDKDHTEFYVSEETGEIQLITTRASRALSWIAAIPHWMYFTPLRLKDQLWRQLVLWTSGIGAVLALLGIVLIFYQFRTRYAGLMRWHYVTGSFFGVFALTWVFSGWLSMEPFFWASGGGSGNRIRQTLAGGPLDLKLFPMPDAGSWFPLMPGRSPKEIEFVRIQGDPYFVARGVESEPMLISANLLQVRNKPFSIDSLMSRIQQGNPGAGVAESAVLSDYDSYYHPGETLPRLPILRVKFSDPDATWIYVDPRMGQAVARFTRRERLQRWIYHGFHSLDFNFWYYNGKVWRIAMVTLNAGGAILSGIGFVLAIRRLRRV